MRRKRGEVLDAVVGDLSEHGPSRFVAIVERTGLHHKHADSALRRLRESGEVVRPHRGVYALPEHNDYNGHGEHGGYLVCPTPTWDHLPRLDDAPLREALRVLEAIEWPHTHASKDPVKVSTEMAAAHLRRAIEDNERREP